MIKTCTISLSLLMGLGSPLALAHFDSQARATGDVRVLSAQPIYETIEYSQPRADCDSPQWKPGDTNPPDTRNARRQDRGYRIASLDARLVCRAGADRVSREEVVAYRIHYRYHGLDYITEMPYDPGTQLPIDFDVQPIRW